MYQAHPSALAPMIATTAITIDKIASLRMAMPSLQAKIKQQRGGFSDFFEVGVGEHRLEIGVKRGPARPSRSRVTRVASDDNAGGELMAAKVRPLPV
jgi:hypothetical protein